MLVPRMIAGSLSKYSTISGVSRVRFVQNITSMFLQISLRFFLQYSTICFIKSICSKGSPEPDKSTTYLLAQGAYLSTKKSIASLATSKVSCCSPRYSDSLKQYLQFKLHFRDGCKHKVNCP